VLAYIIHRAWKFECYVLCLFQGFDVQLAKKEIFLKGIHIVSCKEPRLHPMPGMMEKFEEIQYFLYVVEELAT
jgi:hypothetical protein